MRFLTFLLVFTVMVGFNVLCQEVVDPQVSDANLATKSGDAVRSAHDIGHNRSTKQRGTNCVYSGRGKAPRGCRWKMHHLFNGLSQEQKDLCLKKGIRTYKKCKNLHTEKNKETIYISTPI